MISFNEARNKISSKYDIVNELDDAWVFTWNGAEGLEGGDQGFIVLKDTGEVLRPYIYYMQDAAMPVNLEDDDS